MRGTTIAAARTLAALAVGFDRSIRVSELPVPEHGTGDPDAAGHTAVLEALADTQVHYYPLGTTAGIACLAVGANHQASDHPVNGLAGDIVTHYGPGGPSILRGRALVLGGWPSTPTPIAEKAAVDLANLILIKVRTSTATVRSVPIVAAPPRRS